MKHYENIHVIWQIISKTLKLPRSIYLGVQCYYQLKMSDIRHPVTLSGAT